MLCYVGELSQTRWVSTNCLKVERDEYTKKMYHFPKCSNKWKAIIMSESVFNLRLLCICFCVYISCFKKNVYICLKYISPVFYVVSSVSPNSVDSSSLCGVEAAQTTTRLLGPHSPQARHLPPASPMKDWLLAVIPQRIQAVQPAALRVEVQEYLLPQLQTRQHLHLPDCHAESSLLSPIPGCRIMTKWLKNCHTSSLGHGMTRGCMQTHSIILHDPL